MKNQVKALRCWLFVLVGLMGSCCAEASGTWSSMAIPSVGSGIAELMSDGTVMSMDGSGNCVKLTPDMHGSYVNGTWTVLSSMNYSRWNFCVTVLTNGQLFVAGGEFGGGSAPGQYWNGSSMVPGISQTAEIYDPVNNVWTPINPNL